MTADRRTPTPGSPTVQPGGTYADAVNEEISSLNNRSTCKLSSVAGTNTITAVCTPPLDAYADPQTYILIPVATNTGPVTLNVDGRGAKTVADLSGASLTAGALVVGSAYKLYYDGTIFRIVGGIVSLSDIDALRTSVSSLAVVVATKQALAEKGQPNGYASLVSGKVPTSQLPDALLGALAYQGPWNASTNTPTMPAASGGNFGHYYIVQVSGSTTIDGEDEWGIGDWIVSDGSAWAKYPHVDPTQIFEVVTAGSIASFIAKIAIGGLIFVPAGDYLCTARQNITLNRDTRIVCDPAARFTLDTDIDAQAFRIEGSHLYGFWGTSGYWDALNAEISRQGVGQDRAGTDFGTVFDINNCVRGGWDNGVWMAGRLKGKWNANTNAISGLGGETGALFSGVGERGDYYRISTSGTTNLDGTSSWTAEHKVYFNGTIWTQVTDADPNMALGRGDSAFDLINCGPFRFEGNACFGWSDQWMYLSGEAGATKADDGGPTVFHANYIAFCTTGIALKRQNHDCIISSNIFYRNYVGWGTSEVGAAEPEPHAGDTIINIGNIYRDNQYVWRAEGGAITGAGDIISTGNLIIDWGYPIDETPDAGGFGPSAVVVGGVREIVIADVFNMRNRTGTGFSSVGVFIFNRVSIDTNNYVAGRVKVRSDFRLCDYGIYEGAGVDPNDFRGSTFLGVTNPVVITNAETIPPEVKFRGGNNFNPTSLAPGIGETTTVSVIGAKLGYEAAATFGVNLQGITLTAWVSATDTVSVRFQNNTAGTVNLANAALRAIVRNVDFI